MPSSFLFERITMVDTFQAFNLRDENGVGYGVKQVSGKPRVSTMPFPFDIDRNAVSGYSVFKKIGFTPNVSGTSSEVWSKAGAYAFLATPTNLSMISTSGSDGTGQVGARTVQVTYLDASYVSQQETVILNGLTPVAMSGSILRVNALRVLSAGSAAAAFGNLSLYNNAAGSVVYNYIMAGQNRARNSVYTVPLGQTLYIPYVSIGYSGSALTHSARVSVMATQNDDVLVQNIFYPMAEYTLCSQQIAFNVDVPLRFAATVDIKISVVATLASGPVTTEMRGWLE